MAPHKTIALLLAGLALTIVPAQAQQVGTATAVNPESQSTPPGGQTVTLKVGAHIVHKERIHTTPTGSVQLLFLDKSSLSIAPNTDMVIDEYVYNPSSGSGHMAASITKGALRFVGGQLSHAGQATISTPSATIGIRGGTAIVTPKELIDLFGWMTLPNCQALKRAGFKIMLPCSEPIVVTQAELAYFASLFTSTFGHNAGVCCLTSAQINNLLGPPQGPPGGPGTPPPNGGTDPNTILLQGVQHGTNTIPPPPPPPPPPPCRGEGCGGIQILTSPRGPR
jgi:hypothetical protein